MTKTLKAPSFTTRDCKYLGSPAIFDRGKKLAESNKVSTITFANSYYFATVQGTENYNVEVHHKDILKSDCNCYMGQNGEYCKHVIAVGLKVLQETGVQEDKIVINNLEEAKVSVKQGTKYIKAYSGPSSTWFQYQINLEIGSDIIAEAIIQLSASKENLQYTWNLVLRLSNKLATGGVDDSNGTVGDCIEQLVQKCNQMAAENPELMPLIDKFSQDETGFDFEKELTTSIKP